MIKEVIVYINGKRVTDDEISNYEITNERVKRIFAQALARISKAHGESEADCRGDNR